MEKLADISAFTGLMNQASCFINNDDAFYKAATKGGWGKAGLLSALLLAAGGLGGLGVRYANTHRDVAPPAANRVVEGVNKGLGAVPVTKYTDDVDALTDQNTQLQEQATELQTRLNEKTAALLNTQEQLTAKTAELAQVRKTIAAYGQLNGYQRKKMSASIDDLRAQRNQLITERNELTAKCNELQSECQELTKALSKANEDASRLTHENNTLIRKNNDLNAALDKTSQEKLNWQQSALGAGQGFNPNAISPMDVLTEASKLAAPTYRNLGNKAKQAGKAAVESLNSPSAVHTQH